MRIYWKLIIVLLALSMVPIMFVSGIVFYNARNSLEQDILIKLDVVTDEEVDQVETYFKERLKDLAITQNRFVVKKYLSVLDQFNFDKNNSGYIEVRKEINFQLSYLQNTAGFTCVMLMDKSGKIIYSSNPAYEAIEHNQLLIKKDTVILDEVKTNIILGDIRLNEDKKHPYTLFMVGPVEDFSNKFVGYVVLELDMKTVYEFVQDNIYLGKSWETVLVRKTLDNQVQFISPLKYSLEPPLSLKIALGSKISLPAQKAVLGESGSGTSIDYRGKLVLSAWRPVNLLGWGLVTKVDLLEAFAPIQKLKKILIVIILVIFLSICTAVFGVSKSIADPIHALYKGVEIIRAGNLDYKVGSNVKDEIGQLSRAFDIMTQNLRNTMTSVEKLNQEINERIKIARILWESEEKYRTLVENVQGAIYRCKNDAYWTMEFLSPAIREISGYPDSDFIDNVVRTFESIIYPDDRKHIRENVQKAVVENKAYFVEYRIMHRDGSLHWVNERGRGFKVDNKLTYLDGAIFDITERKKILDKLEFANTEWQRTFDSIGDSIFILDTEFRIIKINKACLEELGLKLDQVVDKKCFEVMHHSEHSWPNCPFEKTLIDNTMHVEEVDDPKLGVSLLITTSPIFNEQGKLIGSVHIAKDITQIKKYRQELEQKNIALQRLDVLKSEFVSVVSHELRTPLSIIKEGISLVLDQIPGKTNPKQDKILSTSKDNIDRLARIIENLLDISRIEAGKIQLNKQLIDINDLVRKVVSTFELKIAAAGLKMQLVLPESKLNILLDEDRIFGVLTNLIGNSLKFTEHGFIEVEIKDKGKEVECIISDSGIGIHQENLSKLFDKFTQFDRVDGPGEKGTGLGLSIAKGIIELHGGKIWAESEFGKGTQLHFILKQF